MNPSPVPPTPVNLPLGPSKYTIAYTSSHNFGMTVELLIDCSVLTDARASLSLLSQLSC